METLDFGRFWILCKNGLLLCTNINNIAYHNSNIKILLLVVNVVNNKVLLIGSTTNTSLSKRRFVDSLIFCSGGVFFCKPTAKKFGKNDATQCTGAQSRLLAT